MFSKIVVGTDGSDASARALTLAVDLALKYDSALHLVHVPEPVSVAYAMGAVPGYHVVTTMPSNEEVAQAAQVVLDAAVETVTQAGGTVANAVHHRGDAAREILNYADAIGADLVVTGRRGLGAVAGLFLGSTSQRITHLAKIAVLSVA